MKQRLLFVFGTRPEAVKLAPVIRAARDDGRFNVRVCVTAQHREMLDQVLELFEITPDVDLNLMRPNQDLFELTARVIKAMKPVLEAERPDWVLVQGDTTTVWAGALAAFYLGIKVGHVEAGLRTYDKRQPFPEEINRQLCSVLADLHFAPTPGAQDNLLKENVSAERIIVTGNTVIDALLWMLERIEHDPPDAVREIQVWANQHIAERRMVLITGHRRESFGEGFRQICQALHDLSTRHPTTEWVYPVHLNPNVQNPVRTMLSERPNVHLLEPLSYAPFAWLMRRSAVILTDSGGIQEEAPSLNKPVLVMRNKTERPEGVAAGCVQLVGNGRDGIVTGMEQALSALDHGPRAAAANPYGDGRAAQRILEALAGAATQGESSVDE
ncbi:MAG: UDP-N-acetylglucosamine 2-epimerase (non-hydrolyzing) [Phycisphaerae bacterium]